MTADFDTIKESLVAASKATCLLSIEFWDAQGRHGWQFATAFFVAPSLLLTAGHAALDPENAVRTDRYLFPQGASIITHDDIVSHSPSVVRCTLVKNEFRGYGHRKSKDIAILSSGSYETQHYVKLSTDPVPIGEAIDIIGYPGEKRWNWLKEKHPELKNLKVSEPSAESLLPTGTLVVTRGAVVHHENDITSYSVSTCPGFSGSCMLYKGKAHGEFKFDMLLLKFCRCSHWRLDRGLRRRCTIAISNLIPRSKANFKNTWDTHLGFFDGARNIGISAACKE